MSRAGTWEVREGDCLERLRELPDESIDSIVTDPPAGISFMGKEWDTFGTPGIRAETAQRQADARPGSPFGGGCGKHIKDARNERGAFIEFMTAVMVECLRVLKPGGHALVWAIPRTSHWTATAVEDAGFEVRDVVTHLFGTGFPKSLNVSKAIDAAAGAEREVVGVAGRSGGGRTCMNDAPGGGRAKDYLRGEYNAASPATAAAKQFDGWGTALKPASEHWILARKPLIGTVAANVLAHGTGALNIDGCRIGTGDDKGDWPITTRRDPDALRGAEIAPAPVVTDKTTGRWPANLTLDEEAAALLDEQSGASRFFYVAKAPKKEKNAGLGDDKNTHPTVKSVNLMRWLCRLITPPDGIVLDPFTGSGSTGCAALAEKFYFIGVEREPEYVKIARARIAAYENGEQA